MIGEKEAKDGDGGAVQSWSYAGARHESDPGKAWASMWPGGAVHSVTAKRGTHV